MPILSMLEQIKGQLMSRFYKKQREVGEEWQGPICPKIKKIINRNIEWANTCYAMPAGQGIFQVQDRDYSFIVDTNMKTCDYRRWDLSGIPCSHAISCLRHERITPESVVPECYSSNSYLSAYGHNVWPCKDKSTWQKVGGNVILPPVYVKKVGRPPKSRKKQPYEVQGSHGPRLTKHGIQMTCRYYGDKGHNRATCSMRKAGLKPKIPAQRSQTSMPVQTKEFFEEAATEVASDMAMMLVETSMPVISQVTAHVTTHCTSMSYHIVLKILCYMFPCLEKLTCQ